MKYFSTMRSTVRKQRGVTLIELLVALALGLAVLVGLSAVYVAAKQAFRFQDTSGRLQEDANFALEMMSRDLRMAGFAGCMGVDYLSSTYFPTLAVSSGIPGGINGPNPLSAVEPTNAAVTVQPLSPQNFIRGFDSVPAAMFGTAPTTSSTDSLFFSGGSSNAVSVTAPMAAASSPLTIASDALGWGSTKVYNMIVSDCSSSSLFAGQVKGAGTQIAHDINVGTTNTGTNSADNFPPSPSPSPIYGVDAIVMPLEWNFYYVATRTGATAPSLYRVFFDGNSRQIAQEVVANVESMKLNYGENLNGLDNSVTPSVACLVSAAGCLPSRQIDVWRSTAGAVTDWSHVVAVRIGLMLVSEDKNAVADVVTSTPTLLGQSYTPPTGSATGRLRKEFSTTVVLRNRVKPR